jgi:hypothetical protein
MITNSVTACKPLSSNMNSTYVTIDYQNMHLLWICSKTTLVWFVTVEICSTHWFGKHGICIVYLRIYIRFSYQQSRWREPDYYHFTSLPLIKIFCPPVSSMFSFWLSSLDHGHLIWTDSMTQPTLWILKSNLRCAVMGTKLKLVLLLRKRRTLHQI